jgi:predicted O-methyltransferase YrrM
LLKGGDVIMTDEPSGHPPRLEAIVSETAAIGFTMAAEAKTGALLRTLAAAKPAGELLELGTGTGYATAWLLDGMDAASRLTSVESEGRFQAIAQKHLGADPRVRFLHSDAAEYLSAARWSDAVNDGSNTAPGRFDLIFADTWPGKFTHLDEAIALLKPGGLYVIDDMLAAPSWPEGHATKVTVLLKQLSLRPDLLLTRMSWATGIVLAVKTHKTD